MSISCIIISSEAVLQLSIEKHIDRLTNYHIQKTFTGVAEAIDYINAHPIDFLFLDTKMQGLNVSDVLKSLILQPKIIVTTNNNHNGKKLSSDIDYIVTPFTIDFFLKNVQQTTSEIIRQMEGKHTSNEFLFLKENKKIVKIDPANIFYIESLKDYLIVHTTDKVVKVRLPLSYLEEKLDVNNFVRIHKSYIVSIDRIDSFSSTSVELNGLELPVGRMYRKNVSTFLNEHFCLAEL